MDSRFPLGHELEAEWHGNDNIEAEWRGNDSLGPWEFSLLTFLEKDVC